MTSPFKTYPDETSSNKPLAINQQEQPIYIISDLIAAKGPAVRLASEIYSQSGGRTPVKYYEEPNGNVTIRKDSKGKEIIAVEKLSLEQHISLLADGVSQGPETKIIIGYSSGGQLAQALATELLKRGHSVELCIIDEPSFSTTADYANSEKKAKHFNQDLVKAARYAAQEAGLKEPGSAILKTIPDECQAVISRIQLFSHALVKHAQTQINKIEDEITQLSKINLDKLQNNAIRAKKVNVTALASYIRNIKTFNRNVVNLIQHGNQPLPDTKLPKAHVLFTDETAKKYGADTSLNYTGGWNSYCEDVISLDPEGLLKDATHMSLLSAENVKAVASLIRTMQAEINSADVMEKQLGAVFGNARKEGLSQEEVSRRIDTQFFKLFGQSRPTYATSSTEELQESRTSSASNSPTATPSMSPSCEADRADNIIPASSIRSTLK